MPDGQQFQYVKLPDGSYGKFASNATDDVIRSQISKDFPNAYGSQFNSPSAAVAAGANPEKVLASTHAELPQEVTKSIQNKAKTLNDMAGFARMGDEVETARGAPPALAAELAIPTLGNPAALARSAIGSALGGAGGAWLGHYGGEVFGNPRLGEKIGGGIGAVGGGLVGGLDKPVFGPWGGRYSIGKMIPWLAREPERAEEETMGSFMNKGYKNVGEPETEQASAWKPFTPSKVTARNMGVNAGTFDPLDEAGFGGSVRTGGIPRVPYSAQRLAEIKNPIPKGSGLRPSESEEELTNLVRRPILTPQEAALEKLRLGGKSIVIPGEGTMGREARLLGSVRARRAARGMEEPE